MPADRARLAAIDAYIERLFVPAEPTLAANLRRAESYETYLALVMPLVRQVVDGLAIALVVR